MSTGRCYRLARSRLRRKAQSSPAIMVSKLTRSVRTAPQSGHNSVPTVSHDSKFNVVLYGVEECRSGLSRPARLESHLSSAVDIFSALDSSIQPQSIKDCFRLGKFSQDAPRPRPIPVKFVRITDVNRIFAKKNGLSSPFSVKPDMSRAQRLLESVLMQERWRLIQSGVSRKSIRLRGDSLYVNHKLHGCVSNSTFVHASAPCGSSQPSSPRSNSPAVEHQQNPPCSKHTVSCKQLMLTEVHTRCMC